MRKTKTSIIISLILVIPLAAYWGYKSKEKPLALSKMEYTRFIMLGEKPSPIGKTIDLDENFKFEIPKQYVQAMYELQGKGKRCMFFDYMSEMKKEKQINSNYKLSANPLYGQRRCK